ncbi:tRNA (cytosine(38)-C(5))-methyltransferase [Aphomia sociella]
MYNKILELYSGIGGMHCGWNVSGLPGEITAAVDINTVANNVYKHNFPLTNLLNKNIQALTPTDIKKFQVNTILMSPPCQPFTRNGKCLDDNDPRTNSFIHLIGILDQLDNIEYILMENVKGFECSSVRNLFIEKLKQLQFDYQEFLLSPNMFGVPNSRLRYYCIAKRNSSTWHFKKKDSIMNTFPKVFKEPHALADIIESDVPDKFLIKDKLLKRANVFDICYKESRRSCCFTKAYSHYVEGTGSVYTDTNPETVKTCFEKANTYEIGSDEFIEPLMELKLRFFTPKEVLSLMSFPEEFDFPKDTSLKQSYRLLGNSVNVKVISELLKLLFDK